MEAVFRGMIHFFLNFQPEGSILDDRPPLEKLVALQHITDAALAFRERNPIYKNGTLFRRQEPAD